MGGGNTEATRQIFQGMGTGEIALFYVLAVISTAIFFYGIWLLVRRYRQSRPTDPRDRRSILRSSRIVASHLWIKRGSGLTGLAHLCVFYGFIVLFIGTTILSIDDHIAKPLGIGFWHGAFYEGYSLFLDVFGALLVVGCLIFAYQRLVMRPARLSYARVDGGDESHRETYRIGDWVFLGTLLFLGVTGFFLESLRIVETFPPFEVWSPVGWVVAHGLRDAGLSPSSARIAEHVLWWIHGIAALTFVAAIPFTKALHMLTGPTSVGLANPRAARQLPSEGQVSARGYERITDFSFKHRLELDACTKCGKCHEVCPARAGGDLLSPRDLILDLREVSNGSLGNVEDPLVAGGPMKSETLWACTQCMACVDICPVGIEHVPIINLMRRTLLEDGTVEPLLRDTLEAIHRTGNSFGEPRRKRVRWAKELPFEVPDARKEPVDLLWFVGDYASFDPRNQKATRAFAELLHAAGVSVGILQEAERTAGNDVRRVGEEGLFESLAEQNIELISGCEFERIVTTDPHTFNTLKNEYPALGAPWTGDQVIHHSQLLLELLRSDALGVEEPVGLRATYHDPCTLGRYNGVFEAPRELLRTVGIKLVEMPRNRSNSFCCGAGGGRIWMKPNQTGGPRPAEMRIAEAVELPDVELFVVACPKDVTMYEDAIKTSGNADRIRLAELSELVHQAVGITHDADPPVPV